MQAIPISVYFPSACSTVNTTASNINQIYPFHTGPNSDDDLTCPSPTPQPAHDISTSRGLDIDLNSIPYSTIDLNSSPLTDILESCWEAMDTTTHVPFSHIPTAPSSSDSAKQQMKTEHPPEETAPIFYDTELNCWTSNISAEPKMKAPNFAFDQPPEETTQPIFYDTESNCRTSNIGHSIQDNHKKY